MSSDFHNAQARPVAMISSFPIVGRIDIVHPPMSTEEVQALARTILPAGLELMADDGEVSYTLRRFDDSEPIKNVWVAAHPLPPALRFYANEDQNLPAWLQSARAKWWDLDSIRTAMTDLVPIAAKYVIDLSVDASVLLDPEVEVLNVSALGRHERAGAKRDEFLREIGSKDLNTNRVAVYWRQRRIVFTFRA